MPEQAFDEEYVSDGKGGTRLVRRTTRTISDTEIERRDAPALLRSRLAVLRTWAGDAKTSAELQAMTAAERLARQAVIEQRVAALSRLCMALIWHLGEDDGS